VVLAGEQVSNRHAFVQIVGGRVFVLDLGSQAGIRLGMSPLMAGWVGPREFVRIGPYHLRFEFTAPGPQYPDYPPPSPLEDRLAESAPTPRLSADIHVDGAMKNQWKFNRCLALIGRSSEARLKLADTAVSTYHCCMVALPGSVWAVDLCSREGMTLNGKPARYGPVREGDSLEIGPYRLMFRPSSSTTSVSLLGPPARSGGSLAKRTTVLETDDRPSVFSHPAPLEPVLFPDAGPPATAQLFPLLQQFGMMQQQIQQQIQQQMMDQFQQMLMMMMQMMQRMQQEQAEALRQEMTRFREVTLLLHEARNASGAPNPAPTPASAPARQNGAARPQPQAANQAAPRPKPSPADQKGGPGDAEVHGEMANRIAALEESRRTIWERIVGMLSGV
jgi:pSer/pThr/pTyr-binding forkhead associated (FHA) protein